MFALRVLIAASLCAASNCALAQNYPSRPARMVVPWTAGGTADLMARISSQKFSESFGQQFVVEHRSGAAGTLGTEAVTRSPPDGYTLILVASGHPLNQFFYPKLPYDTFKDFTAISEVAASPLAIVVAKSSPVKNLQELLGIARGIPFTP